CAQIPTVLNKETGQISLETYKVVACSENLNPYFCVEGPANPNFGQGFFTTNEQRHTMVGVVTSKREASKSGPNGGTEVLYVISLNSLNKYMLFILERDYS
ncbi:unnamed protein product, partial [Allacma fusca]